MSRLTSRVDRVAAKREAAEGSAVHVVAVAADAPDSAIDDALAAKGITPRSRDLVVAIRKFAGVAEVRA